MKKQNEDAPVNATGSAVPGTGSDVAHWKKNKKLKKAKKKLLPKYELWIRAVEELGEGKNMKQFHDLWDDDKTPEEIAKVMKLDLATVKKLMEINEGKLLDRLAKLAKVDGAEAENIVLTLKLDKKFNTGTKGLAWHTLVDTVDKLMKESVDAEASATEVPQVDITPDSTFASMPVFIVDPSDFAKCKFGKHKFSRWAKHINTDSSNGQRIYTYAKKNPNKSIIVQHEKSGHMLFLKKWSKAQANPDS